MDRALFLNLIVIITFYSKRFLGYLAYIGNKYGKKSFMFMRYIVLLFLDYFIFNRCLLLFFENLFF